MFLNFRRYGLVDGRLCFEVGTRGGKLEGAWALLADKADKLVEVLAASSSSAGRSSLGMFTDNYFRYDSYIILRYSYL